MKIILKIIAFLWCLFKINPLLLLTFLLFAPNLQPKIYTMNADDFIEFRQEIAEVNTKLTLLLEKSQEEQPMTTCKVMKILGCSESTLYRLRKKGILKSSLIGGTHYYHKNCITDILLNGHATKPDPSKKFDD